jgi:hypothetical protein
MARVMDAIAVVERQAFAVASVLLASALAAGEAAVAQAVTVGASVVLLVLAAVAATLLDQRRRLAVDLIAEGRGGLPLRAVERERHRLADLRTRARLGNSFERVIGEALAPRRLAPDPLPMVRPWVAAAVAAELSCVAALLRGTSPGLRGVALAQLLLTDGGSPLYGNDVVALREELGRVRFLLRSEG